MPLGVNRASINKKKEWTIPLKFPVAHECINGFARVKIDGKWGLFDKNGEWILEPNFKHLRNMVLVK